MKKFDWTDWILMAIIGYVVLAGLGVSLPGDDSINCHKMTAAQRESSGCVSVG